MRIIVKFKHLFLVCLNGLNLRLSLFHWLQLENGRRVGDHGRRNFLFWFGFLQIRTLLSNHLVKVGLSGLLVNTHSRVFRNIDGGGHFNQLSFAILTLSHDRLMFVLFRAFLLLFKLLLQGSHQRIFY